MTAMLLPGEKCHFAKDTCTLKVQSVRETFQKKAFFRNCYQGRFYNRRPHLLNCNKNRRRI